MAKLLQLDISLDGVKVGEVDKDKTGIAWSVLVIKNVMVLYGQANKGLSEDERRKYYKIADVLEAAEKDGLKEVSLEDDWAGFIRKCFRETNLTPDKILQRVEENIHTIPDR